MAHKWTFVLTDLFGTQLGEVTNAKSRKVTLPLNRLPTATFNIAANHYLSSYLNDDNWDGLLKCYRDSALVFVGPVVTSDNQPDQQKGVNTIQVTASGPMWRLGYRLLGTGSSGWSLGDASTPYDLGYIAQQILAAANGAGYTGITAGTLTSSVNGSAGAFWDKPCDQAIAELSTGLNSFDFEIAPVEPVNVGLTWPQIGLLNCVPQIGSLKPNVIFEYGTTHANLDNYGNTIDRTGLVTRAYINQPAATDHSGVLTSTDAAAETTRGRFEALVDDGGTQWDNLRQAIADENVLVRKKARRVVSLKPKQNLDSPAPLVDFIVGDQIRAIIYESRSKIMDITVRVWGLTFNLDESGNEDVEILTIPPSS